LLKSVWTTYSREKRIADGQLVRLEPVRPSEVQLNDIVFTKWRGGYILHIVLEIKDGDVLIGNALGKVNGWASLDDIVARAFPMQEES
jgi:hypothetical protein